MVFVASSMYYYCTFSQRKFILGSYKPGIYNTTLQMGVREGFVSRDQHIKSLLQTQNHVTGRSRVNLHLQKVFITKANVKGSRKQEIFLCNRRPVLSTTCVKIICWVQFSSQRRNTRQTANFVTYQHSYINVQLKKIDIFRRSDISVYNEFHFINASVV